MSKDVELALDILAGCAGGSTELALTACGVKRETLDLLVRQGAIVSWVQHLTKPRVDVRWFALPGRAHPH